MAYVDLLSSSTSSLEVIGREFGTNQIASLTVYCTNGSSQSMFIAGGSTANYRTTSANFTGLSAGTSYGFYISGSTTGGTAIRVPSSGYTYFSTVALNPSTPTFGSDPVVNTTTGNVNFTITTGLNTSHVRIERSWVGGYDEYAHSSSQTLPYSFVAPSTKGTYTITISARLGSNLSSSSSRSFIVSDPDPSITSLSVSFQNKIELSWSVNNANFMRTSNAFALYMSGADNSTQHFVSYYDSSTRNIERQFDGAGVALQVGKTYRVWLYVYDTDGNSFGGDLRSGTFSRTRPTNFSWSNIKSSGTIYNLTSTEWGNFLDKVNEFRAYKGLVLRDFNRNITGGLINTYVVPTASSYNSAINAVNDMTPSTTTPSSVNTGDIITAYHFTRIRDALNSIT